MELARKRWPVESFGELVRRIVDAGVGVALVGGPDDRSVADRVRHVVGESVGSDSVLPPELLVDLVGQLSLDEVAALAVKSRAYVGNDSGPSHLAEAAGARVVMLFGPSDPIVYGPRSRRATSVSSGLWCSPCFVDGRVAPCANVICMSSISVERVWSQLAPLLAPSPIL
jgi:ADP-heptose:LPS heptosyltransferase